MNSLAVELKEFERTQTSFTGKTVLVTGAGDGIGKTIAIALAKAGAEVLLLGRTEEKLGLVYDEIEKSRQQNDQIVTPMVLPFDLDKAQNSDYEQLTQALTDQVGKLDGLVHCAGVLGQKTRIQDYNTTAWDSVINTNISGAFKLTKCCLPMLEASENGRIIFTSSSVGKKGRAFWGAYAVSKFATEGLMQTLADEYEQRSLNINAINPGATRTAMRQAAYPAENPETVKDASTLVNLYLFLLSEQSQSVNGQSVDADLVI